MGEISDADCSTPYALYFRVTDEVAITLRSSLLRRRPACMARATRTRRHEVTVVAAHNCACVAAEETVGVGGSDRVGNQIVMWLRQLERFRAGGVERST